MITSSALIAMMIERLRAQGYAQVPGYNRFGFVQAADTYLIVSRETGKDTRIQFSKLEHAIEAVRKDSRVYTDGPSRLREDGITHINSPLWALLHLCSLEELGS